MQSTHRSWHVCVGSFNFLVLNHQKMVPPPASAVVPVPVAAPAAFTHPRRAPGAGADHGKLNKLFSDPSFLWSTDVRNKQLVPRYLSHVKAGIETAASDLRLTLDERDLAWLDNHQGMFQMFIPYASQHYHKKVSLVQMKGKSPDVIAEHCLTNNHQVVGPSPRFCRTAAVDTYQSTMESSLRNFWNFLAMTGAYQCMLILLPHSPSECCSVSTRSLKAYMLHKFLPHGTPLHESWGQADGAIKDINEQHMMSEGTVQNKNKFDTLLAAMSHIHNDKCMKLLHSAGYFVQCAGCFLKFKSSLDASTRFAPCEVHASSHSRFCCMGNPNHSIDIKALVNWLDKESLRRGYEVKEKSFILPQDLLHLQIYVASVHYNMWDLQNYTVLLGAIQTAGRFDGYGDLHMEDFAACQDLFDISDLRIKSLAQQVKEKTDKLWHKYLLFFNDACPLMCYLRHLLVFVHCANLGEEGMLFTEEDELKVSDFSTPNKWTRPLLKDKFGGWLQKRVLQNMLLGEMMDIGVHSPRSTFYLFSVLSGGSFHDTMRNARHQTESQARKYHRDAVACMEKLIALGDLPRFPPWRDTLVHKGGAVQKRLLRMSSTRREVPTLKAAAEFFVQSMMHIQPTHARYRDPKYLLEAAYKMNFSTSSVPGLCGDMRYAIGKLPKEYQGMMNLQLQNVLSKVQQCPSCQGGPQTQAAGHHPRESNGVIAGGQLVQLARPQPMYGPTRQLVLTLHNEVWRFGFKDPDWATTLAGHTSLDQAKKIYELYCEICSLQATPNDIPRSYRDGRKKLHSKYNHTFSRWLHRICICIQSCHKGDLVSFQQSNPEFKKARPTYRCHKCLPPRNC
jgi:hypothetical protein